MWIVGFQKEKKNMLEKMSRFWDALMLKMLKSCRFQSQNHQAFWTIDFTNFNIFFFFSVGFHSQLITLYMSRTCQTNIVALLWNRVGVAPTKSSFTFSAATNFILFFICSFEKTFVDFFHTGECVYCNHLHPSLPPRTNTY